jgi:tetratricopeptide (TPR) repeat protein
MRRAETALSGRKYLTAERELRKVLIAVPEMKTAKSDMLIASYYNMDMPSFVSTLNDLKGVSFENSPSFNTAQALVEDAKNFFPSDSLGELLKQSPPPLNLQNQFRSYIIRHPDEPYAVSGYIDEYYESEGLGWCDSVVHDALNANPTSMTCIMVAIFIARMQHRYDSATRYCRQLLAMNAESPYAIAAEARVSMAEGNVAEGIRLARKACELDSSNGYSIATLALGYHLNNQIADRDRLIASKGSDSTISSSMDYVKQIISGKTKFY